MNGGKAFHLVADFGENVQEFLEGIVPGKKGENAGGDGKLGHGRRLTTKAKEKRTVFFRFDEGVRLNRHGST